jgi:hypothetical protein
MGPKLRALLPKVLGAHAKAKRAADAGPTLEGEAPQ